MGTLRVRGGAQGERALGDVDDRVMDAANHHGTGIPMSQTYMFYTCTPELKVQ